MLVWCDFLETIKQLKINFVAATKRILKKDVSKNHFVLRCNRNQIVKSYNNLVSILSANITSYLPDEQQIIHDNFSYAREKLLKCFFKLNIYYPTEISLQTVINTHNLIKFEIDSFDLNLLFENKYKSTLIKMEPTKFINMCTKILHGFDGTPSQLNTFLNNIDLLIDLANGQHAAILFKFVKGRLEGKAFVLLSVFPKT